ncbi:MAG: alpha/beta hydrolase [Vicinamibacteria bacterium]
MTTNTIVLIHGLWMTPHSWKRFQSRYEQRGYRVIAPAWPRLASTVKEVRDNPAPLAGLGLIEVAEHYEAEIRALDRPPIVIGHSMGGLVAQILLDRGLGAAGVAIDAAAPKGVYRLPFSALRAAAPVLLNPFNYGRTVMLTFEQFKYAFANVMSEKEARAAYEEDAVPGPGRPLFEVASGNFSFHAANQVDHSNNRRAPLLLIAGGSDNLVPALINRINFKMYKGSTAVTEYKEFPGRSHLLVAQNGWEAVADYALSWAEGHIANRGEQPAA